LTDHGNKKSDGHHYTPQPEGRSEKCRGGGLIISIQGQLKTALMHSNYKTSASISNNGAITGTGAMKSKENVLNCSNDGFLNS